MPFALPYYGMRIGLGDRVDVGFRIHSTLTLGFDMKLLLLESEGLDIALDPTFEYAWVWGYAYLPLLLGINLSDAVQVVLSGRVGYQLPLVSDLSSSPFDTVLGTEQPLAGGGLGLYIEASRAFGVIPEVQVLRGFGDTHPTIVSVSLGFTLGDQPAPKRQASGGAAATPLTWPPSAPATPPTTPATSYPTTEAGPSATAPAPDAVPQAPPGYSTGIEVPPPPPPAPAPPR